MLLGPLRDDGAAARLPHAAAGSPRECVKSRSESAGQRGFLPLEDVTGTDGPPFVGLGKTVQTPRLGSGRVVREKAHRRLISTAAQELVQQGRQLSSLSLHWADKTAALWLPSSRGCRHHLTAQQDLRSSRGGGASVPWYDCRVPVNVSGVPSHTCPSEANLRSTSSASWYVDRTAARPPQHRSLRRGL